MAGECNPWVRGKIVKAREYSGPLLLYQNIERDPVMLRPALPVFHLRLALGRKIVLMLLEASHDPTTAGLHILAELHNIVVTGLSGLLDSFLHFSDMLLACGREGLTEKEEAREFPGPLVLQQAR